LAEREVIPADEWPEVAFFAARVAAERKARGWTQHQAAQETGLSQPYISQVEMARQNPSLMVMAQFARAFGLPLSALVPDRVIKNGAGS